MNLGFIVFFSLASAVSSSPLLRARGSCLCFHVWPHGVCQLCYLLGRNWDYPGMALRKENSLQANLLRFYYWRYPFISASDCFPPHSSSAWRKVINSTCDKEMNSPLWSQILKGGAAIWILLSWSCSAAQRAWAVVSRWWAQRGWCVPGRTGLSTFRTKGKHKISRHFSSPALTDYLLAASLLVAVTR